MSTPTITRQPKGIPVGGEFSSHARDEASVSLTADNHEVESVWRKHYDTPEDKVTAFMAELKVQVADLATDESWQQYLDTAAKFHNYSFYNQMLIALQNPEAEKVAGFNKWKELGRQVRKGEKGIAILAPRKLRVTVKDAAGNPILDENGKPRKDMRVVGFTTATVFDIAQTDGSDLPDNRMMLSEEPPEGFVEDLETAIAAAGFTVSYSDELRGSNLGYTSADGSMKVVIKAGMNAGSTARTLAHELGHIKAGHIEKIEEYHQGHDGKRGQFEVEADSISYSLLRINGMSPGVGRANAAYISGWGKRDPETVEAAGKAVSKAVKEIIDGSKWRNAA
jgi:antirestriction protein ArdC